MSTTLDLVQAIINKDAVETETAFNAAMAERVSAGIDALRTNVAQNMFTQQAVSEEHNIYEATDVDATSKHAEHIASADTDDEAKKRIAKVPTKHLQAAHHWNLGYSGSEHKYKKHVKSELENRGKLLSSSESSKRFDEAFDISEKNWIAGAIKKPGAETAAAKRAGMSTHEYMEKHKHDSGKAGKRARLGLTLSKLNKK